MARQMIYDALIEHAKGHIKKHSANVEIYMEKAVMLVNILIY